MSAAGAALVLLAAGSGQRSGHATNKVLLPLAGRRVFTWSLRATASLPEITRTVLVGRAQDLPTISDGVAGEFPTRAVTVLAGGSTRHASEWAALSALAGDIRAGAVDVVVIHDAARPLAHAHVFREVIYAAREHGGALPGRPVTGLLARDPTVGAPLGETVAVQTPQAFRARPLLAAYEAAERDGFVGSDTASCVERYSPLDIAYLAAAAHNIKITFPEDLVLAERLAATARPPVG